ncbi:hydantoinase/oxoprolinase N-terminal domain-containing protein [Bdellovibrio sp. NC01]|uniref:hydantoinase/oxoprolinase N-terminal domain-containing protein n=1 Tax=Bdellovibrio sp. NC01 TaxID=2220073 RepID=UPI00115A60BB|nr:hydantoinase/oxoprolinase N-terminal domain-containing protein [Bdellovibrio sp. NC01]QDK36999.1 hydantoin utilization protein [Bdellovibrio sp. NC01]
MASRILGVSVGESFAEYCVLDGAETVATKRAYLSRENLKNSLQQFISTHSDKKISKAAVSLRVPEKLLDFKLNGAVAHITTEGFEHWLDLHNSTNNTLTTAELQFSLRERVQADGKISLPLAMDELEAIAAKLEMMQTKKVCVHLLHSAINPTHQTAVTNFLTAKGFEVFVPEKTDNADEVTRWRKNSLNATVAGLFSELKKEIAAALQNVVAESDIHFLTGDGTFTQDIEKNSIASLSAGYAALALAHKKSDVLYMGLEGFVLISGNAWKNQWLSPWGAVESKHVSYKELTIQPTLPITLNAFHHFDFDTEPESWDPGPMFLGRGQKATLIDLWADNAKLTKLDGLQDRTVAAGVQKFKNSMFALSKVSNTREKELPSLSKELQSLAIQKIAMEAVMFRHSKELLITGPLVELFANGFKKDTKASVDTNEFALSRAVALLGQSALKG